jgi:hypothetical protein
MEIETIKKIPNSLMISKELFEKYDGVHSALFRDYHILDKVKEMLKEGSHVEEVLTLIEEIRYPRGDQHSTFYLKSDNYCEFMVLVNG